MLLEENIREYGFGLDYRKFSYKICNQKKNWQIQLIKTHVSQENEKTTDWKKMLQKTCLIKDF